MTDTIKQLTTKMKELQTLLAEKAAAGEPIQHIADQICGINTDVELARELRKALVKDKPRIPYIGVYYNTGDNMEEKPYRAAICMNKGKDNQKWLNLGYFSSMENAARAFNVYSITIFKGKGLVNSVDIAAANAEEWNSYAEKKADRVKDASAIVKHLRQANESLRFFTAQAEEALV